MIPIRQVTVHPDGAMIRRQGEARSVDGHAVIGGLPLLLDTATLRVEVEGAPVVDVRLELDPAVPEESDDDARERLQVALEAHATLAARRAALEAERETLRTLTPAYVDEADPPSAETIEAWAGAEDVLEPWADRIDADLRDLRKEEEAMQEHLMACRLAVQQASDEAWWKRWMPTHALHITVDGDGPLAITLSYRMSGATWSPSYLLVCDDTLVKARFAMRALVVQATGEDWSDVALAVSTAPCRRRVDLPKLPALRLGVRQPPPPPAWRPLPPGLDALFPDEVATLEPAPEPSPVDDTDVFGVEVMAAADTEPDTLIMSRPLMEGASDAPMPPPPPAPASAPPMPQSMPAPARRAKAKRAPVGGALRSRSVPQRPSQPPDGLDADPDHLDYTRLRLAGPEAPRGQRGRLQPLSEAAWLAEAGLPVSARRRYRDVVAELRAAMNRARDRALPPHHVRPGPVRGADTVCRAKGEVHLPSDGRFHSVALFEEPIELTTRYVAVPRHDARVYRRVTASLQRSEPLLPGPVEVLVDGALEITTPWQGTASAGALTLHLGVEDRLEVARNVRYEEASAGMFGGRRTLTTRIEVDVASAMSRDVEVELMERVPVASEGVDVSVELVEAAPRAVPWEGGADDPLQEGLHRQRLPLPAGGRGHARLVYAVTLSAKDELVGGDRRG